jgi:hypothetical protein
MITSIINSFYRKKLNFGQIIVTKSAESLERYHTTLDFLIKSMGITGLNHDITTVMPVTQHDAYIHRL